MAQVTLKGNPVHTKGELPAVGRLAPHFRYVKQDLSEGQLSDLGAKVKVILAVPSLDTGTCALETKTFNKKLAALAGVEGLVISMDLPFAMKRFCELEGVKNVQPASDFRYREFTEHYNTLLTDGPLKGISARAVLVLDKDNTISYAELVPEISAEPQYEAALEVVKKLIAA